MNGSDADQRVLVVVPRYMPALLQRSSAAIWLEALGVGGAKRALQRTAKKRGEHEVTAALVVDVDGRHEATFANLPSPIAPSLTWATPATC